MNVLVFLALLLLLEAAGQVIALIRPSYDVLFLQPDEIVGWKQVLNLHWTWAGHDWYAADFSVKVETNPLGFRDTAREFPKSHGVKRIALLGDSFIEAVQVPFQKTAGQLLERNNSLTHDLAKTQKWEVLNFGISNYGVGQYLLIWEQYAKKYDPDYVAIFVAKFHMQRTIEKYESGVFSQDKGLWIRPTFRIENKLLRREPAEDVGEFVKVQNDLIKTGFAGKRVRRKTQVVTVHYARLLWSHLRELVQPRSNQRPDQVISPSKARDADANLFAVNLKIIEELGRQVHKAESRLVVLDASQYFGDDANVSSLLKELCASEGFAYIPLYNDLVKAKMNGLSTRWAHDGHFNEAGNRILAEALYDWIVNNSHGVSSDERKKTSIGSLTH